MAHSNTEGGDTGSFGARGGTPRQPATARSEASDASIETISMPDTMAHAHPAALPLRNCFDTAAGKTVEELTLADCLDGLAGLSSNLKKIEHGKRVGKPTHALPRQPRARLRRPLARSGGGGGGGDGGSNGSDPELRFARPARSVVATLQPAKAQKVHYAPAGKPSRVPALGVHVRPDGSATAKWPKGQTAVSMERDSDGSFSLSAFYPNGTLAVMLDSAGHGAVNYPAGTTALSCSCSGTGFVMDQDGSEVANWRCAPPAPGLGHSQSAPALPTQHAELAVNDDFPKPFALTLSPAQLAIEYSPHRSGLADATVFFRAHNIRCCFSMTAGCALLDDGTDLFGRPMTAKQLAAAQQPTQTQRRSRRGEDAGEAASGLLDGPGEPLTHDELIEKIRQSTSSLIAPMAE